MNAWRTTAGIIGAVLALATSTAALADNPPDYGFDWVTIGAAGNRDTIPSEVPRRPTLEIGGVNHEYRIMRSQVTTEQWFEFVNAYTPFLDTTVPWDMSYTGGWLHWDGHRHTIDPGAERYATAPSFQYAARYVNWLHNGKVNEKWAFENGAYDTSTFTMNPDHSWNSQEHHHPNANFWIPSLDEWVKAVHYDPNRYGPGQEGYWLFPDGGDDMLYSDWPWNGGETSTDIESWSGPWLDVGSYPWTQSPWGLLDASGSEWDWIEDFTSSRKSRYVEGTRQFESGSSVNDRIDYWTDAFPDFAWSGFRLVTVVPGPTVSVGLIGGLVFFAHRRRS